MLRPDNDGVFLQGQRVALATQTAWLIDFCRTGLKWRREIQDRLDMAQASDTGW